MEMDRCSRENPIPNHRRSFCHPNTVSHQNRENLKHIIISKKFPTTIEFIESWVGACCCGALLKPYIRNLGVAQGVPIIHMQVHEECCIIGEFIHVIPVNRYILKRNTVTASLGRHMKRTNTMMESYTCRVVQRFDGIDFFLVATRGARADKSLSSIRKLENYFMAPLVQHDHHDRVREMFTILSKKEKILKGHQHYSWKLDISSVSK
jgi:hypothetical protein